MLVSTNALEVDADEQVENFLFYVLCDAATSRRDQVMAFFSKVHSHGHLERSF